MSTRSTCPNRKLDKEALARLNIPRFVQLRDHIKQFPETYNQGVWGVRKKQAKTACGTVACLAGRDLIIAKIATPLEVGKQMWRRGKRKGEYIGSSDFRVLASSDLRLTSEESDRLFGPGMNWPTPYGTRMQEAYWGYMIDMSDDDHLNWSLRQSKIAIAYLSHIISTGRILD